MKTIIPDHTVACRLSLRVSDSRQSIHPNKTLHFSKRLTLLIIAVFVNSLASFKKDGSSVCGACRAFYRIP
jgi:hypothetical protein